MHASCLLFSSVYVIYQHLYPHSSNTDDNKNTLNTRCSILTSGNFFRSCQRLFILLKSWLQSSCWTGFSSMNMSISSGQLQFLLVWFQLVCIQLIVNRNSNVWMGLLRYIFHATISSPPHFQVSTPCWNDCAFVLTFLSFSAVNSLIWSCYAWSKTTRLTL